MKSLLQMVVGRMWSWWQLLPGRIPLRARNTARGEPMQKKFSTYLKKKTMLMSCEHDKNVKIIDFTLNLRAGGAEGLEASRVSSWFSSSRNLK